jgi:hypothetical protein
LQLTREERKIQTKYQSDWLAGVAARNEAWKVGTISLQIPQIHLCPIMSKCDTFRDRYLDRMDIVDSG